MGGGELPERSRPARGPAKANLVMETDLDLKVEAPNLEDITMPDWKIEVVWIR